MAGKRKQPPTPLEQLESLLGQFTNDDLLEALLHLVAEGAERLANYEEVVADGSASRDVLNEAIVFAMRLDKRTPPWFLLFNTSDKDMEEASHAISQSRRELEAAVGA
jgi:hypothetical protein